MAKFRLSEIIYKFCGTCRSSVVCDAQGEGCDLLEVNVSANYAV